MTDNQICDLGNVVLQSGATPSIAYKTYGELNAQKDNVIFSTWQLVPASSDLHFPLEDSEVEVKHMPNAELRICQTDWGHFGGDPRGTSPDIVQVDTAIKELLAR